ncbi:unnamed protein product, partial [Brassica oleracea]
TWKLLSYRDDTCLHLCLKAGLNLFNMFSIVWASVSIKGKDPFSGERLTQNRVLRRSSPPHWRDVSGTFRRETVQPLLPLIGTSTMCLQCDPCVSEAVGFLRINRGQISHPQLIQSLLLITYIDSASV